MCSLPADSKRREGLQEVDLKNLLRILSVILAAAMQMAIIFGLQYLAIEGPDWVVAATTGENTNEVLIVAGVFLTLANGIILCIDQDWISEGR